MKTRHLLLAIAATVIVAGFSLWVGRFQAYLIGAVAVASIGALALNLLIGACGQISLAQGALLGVGAYAAGNFGNAGWDILALPAAGLTVALASALIGLPALRLRGLYFAIASLAAQAILEYLFKTVEPLTKGISGLVIKPMTLFGIPLVTDQAYAALSVVVMLITWLFMVWVMRTNIGRAFLVVRESEIVARGMGIDVARTKLWAFTMSGFFVGLAGALMGFTTRLANPEAFGLQLSVDYVAMIIVGGIGSWGGSIIGAAFVVLLPELIERLGEVLNVPNVLSAMRELAFGLLIILFLIFEPRGLAALLGRLRPRANAAAAAIFGRKQAWKPQSANRRRV